MEEKKQETRPQEERPAPRTDVDDFIFRDQGWHFSDR